LISRRIPLHTRFDVEPLRLHPVLAAVELIVLQLPRDLDEAAEREIPRVNLPAWKQKNGPASNDGRRLDGCNVELLALAVDRD
jgi:hypothetical protein